MTTFKDLISLTRQTEVPASQSVPGAATKAVARLRVACSELFSNAASDDSLFLVSGRATGDDDDTASLVFAQDKNSAVKKFVFNCLCLEFEIDEILLLYKNRFDNLSKLPILSGTDEILF